MANRFAQRVLSAVAQELEGCEHSDVPLTEVDLQLRVISAGHRLYDTASSEAVGMHIAGALAAAPSTFGETRATYAAQLHRIAG